MNSAQATRFIVTLFLSMSLSVPAHAVAVRLIPNLTSITFYERIPGDVGLAIDGNLQTHTTMGNTIGQTQRLRVTLGFQSALASSSAATIPTQSEWGLIVLIAAIAAMAWFATRSRAAG